ncbi:hypothetical protein A9HBioS_0011 [Pseudomonas koreensis]|uniref:Uncharacterized protein n=1 Tax=Pseudomonas koreensis TaxID=198620 RepID=A0AA94JJN0_9PSED|nr:hypothetical protein A9HBioS_0011 [Pseudomonas koreensis]
MLIVFSGLAGTWHSVVVDGVNPLAENRQAWADIAAREDGQLSRQGKLTCWRLRRVSQRGWRLTRPLHEQARSQGYCGELRIDG